MFQEILNVINNKMLNNQITKCALISKIINQLLFKGINIIECTSIPFVFEDEIQLDYENIGMAIVVKKNVEMEFLKFNVVSGTYREVQKSTFIRNAKKYNESMTKMCCQKIN